MSELILIGESVEWFDTTLNANIKGEVLSIERDTMVVATGDIKNPSGNKTQVVAKLRQGIWYAWKPQVGYVERITTIPAP